MSWVIVHPSGAQENFLIQNSNSSDVKAKPEVLAEPHPQAKLIGSSPKKVALSTQEIKKYTAKADKLINDAVRLGSKNKSLAVEDRLNAIKAKDGTNITDISTVKLALTERDAAMKELSGFKVSQFGNVLEQKDENNEKNFDTLFDGKKDSSSKNQAYNALKNSINAQTTYVECLSAAYAKNPSPALQKEITKAQLTLGELANFSALLIDKKLNQQSTVFENLSTSNPEVLGHLSLLKSLVGKELSDVFKSLDKIDSTITPNDFNSKIKDLSAKIRSLNSQLDKIKANTKNEIFTGRLNGEKVSLGLNTEIIDSLKQSLKAAESRVLALKKPDYKTPIQNCLKTMTQYFDISPNKTIVKAGSPADIFFQNCNKLSTKIQKSQGKMQSAEIKALYTSLKPATIFHKLANLANIMEDPGGLFGEGIEKTCLLLGITEKEYKDNQKSFTPLIIELGKQFRIINNTIANLDSELIEYQKLKTGPQNSIQKGKYITFAFEHDIDLASLTEASMRGIPPEHIGTLNYGKFNQSFFGAGGINSVTSCKGTDSAGFNQEVIFKPETTSRRGLRSMASAGKLGYTDTTSVTNLNMLSHSTAGLLGHPKLICTSKAGMLNGKFGFFMDKAPGANGSGFEDKTKTIATLDDGTKLNKDQLITHLSEKDLLSTTQKSLKMELCKLEWTDFLTGQADRHPDNYLVDINPNTGKTQVTGIDNDSCFAKTIIGPALYDLKALPDKQRQSIMSLYEKHVSALEKKINNSHDELKKDELKAELAALKKQYNPDKQHLDTTGLDPRGFRGSLGINSCSVKAKFIDSVTYDKLININPKQYEDKLRSDGLPEDMIESAMQRLHNCIKEAKLLDEKGCVIDENEPTSIAKLDNLSSTYYDMGHQKYLV